jgi:hypothetical protein
VVVVVEVVVVVVVVEVVVVVVGGGRPDREYVLPWLCCIALHIGLGPREIHVA